MSNLYTVNVENIVDKGIQQVDFDASKVKRFDDEYDHNYVSITGVENE